MARSRKQQQAVEKSQSTEVATIKTIVDLELAYRKTCPYLGKARYSHKSKDGQWKLSAEVITIAECVGNLGRIYDVLFGNKGVERTADWKPTDAQRDKALEVKKSLSEDFKKLSANGGGITATVFGQQAEVVRLGRQRIVRDKVTGDLKQRQVPAVLGLGFSTEEVLNDKVDRNNRERQAIRAWAKAQNIEVKLED